MMEAGVRYLLILSLLGLSTAFAQTATPSMPNAKAQHQAVVRDDDDDDDDDTQTGPAAPTSNLAGRTPVITIKGMCDAKAEKAVSGGKTSSATACVTTISRKDFEELADAVQPGMTAAKREQLGDAYAKFVVMSHEAKKRGLDKQERFHELMEFARIQILTQELDRALQKEAANVPEQDIASYYQKNRAMFVRASFERIFIPHSRQMTTPDPMMRKAEGLQARATVGEDFEQLEKEAFAAAGLKGTAPTNMGAVRASNLPPGHSEVFALSPGQVSQVIADSTGFYIYKMLSKQGLGLEQVKAEIAETLRGERMKQLSQKIQESSTIELNSAYFAPSEDGSSSGAASRTAAEDATNAEGH